MRDKKGRFKKNPFSKKKIETLCDFLVSVCFFITAILYFSVVFELKEFKEQALKNGCAIYVDGKFTLVEIRKAIIP